MATTKRKSTAEKERKIVSLELPNLQSAPPLSVLKTYKLYIDGKFPRSESGRYYQLRNRSGQLIANVSWSSRKDFRDSVVAADSGFKKWTKLSAFNRSQVIYRIAEMLNGRRSQFVEELIQQEVSKKDAEKEVAMSIDTLIHYAGWCDKFTQIFSSVNPVASSHFNFSLPEPLGIVAAIAPESSALLGIVATVAPIIAGGNSCVVLAAKSKPLSAVTFSEVLATSDLPAGVVNILTGDRQELLEHFASHMQVHGLLLCDLDPKLIKLAQELSAENLKRVTIVSESELLSAKGSPYRIMNFQELKTTWHPVGV